MMVIGCGCVRVRKVVPTKPIMSPSKHPIRNVIVVPLPTLSTFFPPQSGRAETETRGRQSEHSEGSPALLVAYPIPVCNCNSPQTALILPLHHGNWHNTGHLFSNTCAVNHLNHPVYIFISHRCFLGQTSQAAGPHAYTLLF